MGWGGKNHSGDITSILWSPVFSLYVCFKLKLLVAA